MPLQDILVPVKISNVHPNRKIKIVRSTPATANSRIHTTDKDIVVECKSIFSERNSVIYLIDDIYLIKKSYIKVSLINN